MVAWEWSTPATMNRDVAECLSNVAGSAKLVLSGTGTDV